MTYPLIRITHNSVDITNKTLSYERSQSLCTGVGTLNLQVEYETSVNIQPWDTIILFEGGHRKGTYFVSGTDKGARTGTMDVSCQDASKKLTDYYITDIYNVNYMSYARYWIEKFLVEVGISYTFTTDSDGALLSENFALGPASAFETIQTLLQNSGWYMFFNNTNTCIIGELTSDLNDIDKVIRDDIIERISTSKDDKMLRNRAVVWGNYSPTDDEWVFADLIQHTPWDRNANDIRTVVVANSAIRNNASAYTLAAKMLEEFANISYTKEVVLIGEHNILLGDMVRLRSKYHHGDCLITTIQSRADKDGLRTIITLDQRCPRLFGFAYYTDYVYVGTDGTGVWRKPLDSNLWESFSTGIDINDFYISDLIIKNGIFACVGGNTAYVNLERTADWGIYDPITLVDIDSFSFPTGSYKAVAVDIDSYSNNILIGYRLLDETVGITGENKSWVVEITPDRELVSVRQVYLIDRDHQNFKLIDVEKYSAERLCTAEAPAGYATSDPDFWGTHKVYRFEDPDPKSIILGPPPECEVYTDPLVEVATHAGAYYEDSHSIIEGNAISGFWSGTWLTTFTYDYVIGDTPYNISHLIEWPITYTSPYGGVYLFARTVYRVDAHGLSDVTKEKDRLYHVCDIVNHSGEIYIYHHTVTPLLDCYPYQIQNVDCATTENVTLYGEQTIDGVSAIAGTRVLVKDQTNTIENGIYYTHADAVWSRSIETNLDETLQNGMFVVVDSGTLNRWTAWQVEADSWNTIGVSEIIFTQVLELLAGSAQYIGGSSEFHVELPNVDYTAVFDRRPKMRNGVIYYLYDGHVNTNTDPGNPFLGPGTHYFYAFSYDIANWISTKNTLYQYEYWGGYKPSIHTYSATELIPAGLGVGFAMFIFTWYPKYESKCDLFMASLIPGGNNNVLQELWKCEGYNDSGCGLTTDGTEFGYNGIAWTGTEMHGKNPSVDSYIKFKINCTDTTLVCPCIWPGNEFFTQKETMITGNANLRDFSYSTIKGYRGWELKDCQRDPLPDTLDYAEIACDYTQIYPLYVRDASAIYLQGPVTIYDSKNLSVSTGPLGYLDVGGLVSQQQDDFDKGIYVFDSGTRTVYKESTTGAILSTLNIPSYNWPSIGIITNMVYTNGYFFFVTGGYKSRTQQHFVLKLKDEYLFPGKNLCYLMEENRVVGSTRTLDYAIKDYDFYDLSTECSQEYPLVSWTTGSSLVVYSGCDGIIYSGGNPHFRWYSIELDQTTLEDMLNDARVFTTTGVPSGSTYQRYIGFPRVQSTEVLMIPSESIDISEELTLYTCSGITGKLEVSNALSPYMFISTSGTGFLQRDPYTTTFVDYTPGFDIGEITVIRMDDQV